MYEEVEKNYARKNKLLNLDALVEKLNEFYESGNTDKILGYAKALEKRMVDSKNEPERAALYLKGAINSYYFLEDYENIERLLKKGKSLGVPKPKIIMSAEPTEDELKVTRIINEVYGAPIVKKKIKKVLKSSYTA